MTEILKLRGFKEERDFLSDDANGAKNRQFIRKPNNRFTNSDPQLVKTFLGLFRKSFKVDIEKFRVCVHLHQYHNIKKQLNFWSNITDIPLKQFIKPFNKPNTGKRIKEGYNGCVSIRYHDVNIARQLLATAQAFFIKQGTV